MNSFAKTPFPLQQCNARVNEEYCLKVVSIVFVQFICRPLNTYIQKMEVSVVQSPQNLSCERATDYVWIVIRDSTANFHPGKSGHPGQC